MHSYLSEDDATREKTSRAVTIPLDVGWSDAGTWNTMWKLGDKDEAGNVVSGDVVAIDTEETYIRGNGRLVTTLA